jgi:hypothetical protein
MLMRTYPHVAVGGLEDSDALAGIVVLLLVPSEGSSNLRYAHVCEFMHRYAYL